MKLKVIFQEVEEKHFPRFAELDRSFRPDFGEVSIIERTDIPSEYGRIAYDQNRTITVS